MAGKVEMAGEVEMGKVMVELGNGLILPSMASLPAPSSSRSGHAWDSVVI